jgi:hypothetical protein
MKFPASKGLDRDLQRDVIVFLRTQHVRCCYQIGLEPTTLLELPRRPSRLCPTRCHVNLLAYLQLGRRLQGELEERHKDFLYK